MTDTATARDDMNGLVNAVMAAQWPTVGIQWQGKGDETPPDGQLSWIRVTIVHGPAGQASLADDKGRRRWNRVGSLIIQCFVPLNKGSADGAVSIATSLQNALQGVSSPNGVWFRNAAIREVGKSGSWFQVNFSVSFTYDDIN